MSCASSWVVQIEEFNDNDRQEYELLRELGPEEAAKRLTPAYKEWTRGLVEHPEQFLAKAYETPDGDRWFFDDQTQVELLLEGFREYARPGPLGSVWEAVADPASVELSVGGHLDPRPPVAR